MAKDTVTLALQGEVSLEQFAEAVRRFSALVSELSAETKATGVRWEISDLEVGSTMATARGVADEPKVIERVVHSYLEVGQALEGGTTVPFSPRVQAEAQGLAAILTDGIQAVRFETAEADAIVTRLAEAKAPQLPEPTEPRTAYGAVTGRVQTLTSRNRLRFVLYDTIHDRAVSCYLAEGSEDQARDIWDKMATVEGMVSRDPLTGRPLTVREIRRVEILDEGEPSGYERARGARPRRRDEAKAEERIRRLRDAG
jgi:hypothetical protein